MPLIFCVLISGPAAALESSPLRPSSDQRCGTLLCAFACSQPSLGCGRQVALPQETAFRPWLASHRAEEVLLFDPLFPGQRQEEGQGRGAVEAAGGGA